MQLYSNSAMPFFCRMGQLAASSSFMNVLKYETLAVRPMSQHLSFSELCHFLWKSKYLVIHYLSLPQASSPQIGHIDEIRSLTTTTFYCLVHGLPKVKSSRDEAALAARTTVHVEVRDVCTMFVRMYSFPVTIRDSRRR